MTTKPQIRKTGTTEKRKMLKGIVPVIDCAFLEMEDDTCKILNIGKCNALEECKFFKTHEELKAGREKTIKRHKELGIK